MLQGSWIPLLSVALALVLGCGGGREQAPESPQTPEPPAATNSLLSVKLELKNPSTTTAAEFSAVLARLQAIGSQAPVAAARHPAAGLPCSQCHTDAGKIGLNHVGLVIDESAPSASCGACHDLEKAGKLPFWTNPSIGLDDPANLEAAAELLAFAAALRQDLPAHLLDLPEIAETKLAVELLGNTETQAGGRQFQHARDADMVPAQAVNALTEQALAIVGGVSSPTKLEGKFEAKVRRAFGLERCRRWVETLPSGVLALTKETKAELKYKPTPLPQEALVHLAAEVASNLPLAALTKDEPLRKEWEIPQTASSPKGEIKSEIKAGSEAKIEFKKLAADQYPAVFSLLGRIQQTYADIANEFAKYELAFEATAAQDQHALLDALAALELAAPNGDLKLELKHKDDGAGVIPGGEELTGEAMALITAAPERLRKIKAEIKFATSALTFKEAKIELVTSARQGADVLLDGVVDLDDAALVSSHLGQPATALSEADLDEDGDIDEADLAAVRARFDCPEGICD